MARVVLLKNVPNVGNAGDILEVKPGYAANYLFPKKLARVAVNMDDKRAEDEKKNEVSAAKNKQKLVAKLVSYASAGLKKNPVKVEVNTSAGGKVHGSISAEQVVEGLIEKMPEIKSLDPKEYEIKMPPKIEYAGKYIIDMVINLDGKDRNLSVVPLYVDIVSANDSKK